MTVRLGQQKLCTSLLTAASGVALALTGQTSGAVGAPTSTDDGVDHVLAISVDGLKPAAIRQLGTTRAPNFHQMRAQGASTFNARSLYERTITLPNHTTMVTGRTVNGRAGHHVGFNYDNGSTVQEVAGQDVSSVFSVVHDHGGSTGLFTTKSKFALLDRSWNETNGAPDTVGADNGTDKIDRFVLQEDGDVLVDRVRSELTTAPRDFTFLHLGLPDAAGHAHGFMSSRYLDAVAKSDVLLGRLLDAVANDPYLSQHLTVILTADHGGTGKNHSDVTLRANYRIPFIVWGAGVTPGANLYALNPDRARPGVRRIGYGVTQPVRNGDVANLALDLLDLPIVPGSYFDRHMALDVSLP